MPKLTTMQRAERWMSRLQKQRRSNAANYNFLAKKSAICYEAAELQKLLRQQTPHDVQNEVNALDAVLKFKFTK